MLTARVLRFTPLNRCLRGDAGNIPILRNQKKKKHVKIGKERMASRPLVTTFDQPTHLVDYVPFILYAYSIYHLPSYLSFTVARFLSFILPISTRVFPTAVGSISENFTRALSILRFVIGRPLPLPNV